MCAMAGARPGLRPSPLLPPPAPCRCPAAAPQCAVEWALLLQDMLLYCDWPESALKYAPWREEYDDMGVLVFRGPRYGGGGGGEGGGCCPWPLPAVRLGKGPGKHPMFQHPLMCLALAQVRGTHAAPGGGGRQVPHTKAPSVLSALRC